MHNFSKQWVFVYIPQEVDVEKFNVGLTFNILIKFHWTRNSFFPLFYWFKIVSTQNHVLVQLYLSSVSGSANLTLLLDYTYTAWIDTVVSTRRHVPFSLCPHLPVCQPPMILGRISLTRVSAVAAPLAPPAQCYEMGQL